MLQHARKLQGQNQDNNHIKNLLGRGGATEVNNVVDATA